MAAAQEQVKEITGSVPIRELLGDEDKLLHLALKEDPANSYKEYGEDGSSIVHTAYTPFPCGNPRCGVCHHHSAPTESQKVASSSNVAAKYIAGSTREFDDVNDYLFREY